MITGAPFEQEKGKDSTKTANYKIFMTAKLDLLAISNKKLA